jgi:hypothetical protein
MDLKQQKDDNINTNDLLLSKEEERNNELQATITKFQDQVFDLQQQIREL